MSSEFCFSGDEHLVLSQCGGIHRRVTGRGSPSDGTMVPRCWLLLLLLLRCWCFYLPSERICVCWGEGWGRGGQMKVRSRAAGCSALAPRDRSVSAGFESRV
jgi:hypothetical protein